MRFLADQIISNQSMNANIVSGAYDLNQMAMYAVQAVYSGNPTGTILLQASCDPVSLSSQVVNWTTIANSSVSISSAGSSSWNYSLIGYRWVQVVYTFSSGSGTLNVSLNAKG